MEFIIPLIAAGPAASSSLHTSCHLYLSTGMSDSTVRIRTMFPSAKLPSPSKRQTYLFDIERDLDLGDISADIAL